MRERSSELPYRTPVSFLHFTVDADSVLHGPIKASLWLVGLGSER